VGFELTIPVFEREKMVHASDCAAAVILKSYLMVYFRCQQENEVKKRKWLEGVPFLQC
jgi:hypothetical protein